MKDNPVRIQFVNASKKFSRQVIFKDLTISFSGVEKWVIKGANGSGKSTLLQIISGHESLSSGNIEYFIDNNPVRVEQIFKYLVFAAPYLELIEEFTLEEIINFHFKFKQPEKDIIISELPALFMLDNSRKKIFKYFSSGMKQRVKLGLAMTSKTPIVLLDEPVSNLDAEGINWYKMMTENFLSNKLVFVCSNNQPDEYYFCNREFVLPQ